MICPSVTEVLRPWMDLSHIAPGALERGSTRHSAYAAHLLGIWAPPIDPQDQGQLDSFRRWADKYILKVWFVEKQLTDEGNGYRGTLDFGGELTFCLGVIMDWKPPSGKGPITRAQVASYLNLAQKNNYLVRKGGILRMDPDGGIATVEWLESSGIDFNGFLACLNAYRYFKS
jgi:hypothetical protein